MSGVDNGPLAAAVQKRHGHKRCSDNGVFVALPTPQHSL
ncbi:hypothetical protein J2S78_003017 [Salibacterium salarium]|nr:hypothetical protein [Salibacterium salarium]